MLSVGTVLHAKRPKQFAKGASLRSPTWRCRNGWCWFIGGLGSILPKMQVRKRKLTRIQLVLFTSGWERYVPQLSFLCRLYWEVLESFVKLTNPCSGISQRSVHHKHTHIIHIHTLHPISCVNLPIIWRMIITTKSSYLLRDRTLLSHFSPLWSNRTLTFESIWVCQ